AVACRADGWNASPALGRRPRARRRRFHALVVTVMPDRHAQLGMIEGRALEPHAVVGECLHERRHRDSLALIGSPTPQRSGAVVAADGIEIDDLLEGRLAARVE